MSGFLTIMCTLAAFVLLGCGIYAAVCQIASEYAAFSNSLQREVDDFGDAQQSKVQDA